MSKLVCKFRSADFSLEDEQYPGRPVDVVCDKVNLIIPVGHHSTIRSAILNKSFMYHKRLPISICWSQSVLYKY